jgi:hypothetical protein
MKVFELELRGKMYYMDRDILMNVSGIYFTGIVSGGAWQPNNDRVYVIDGPSEYQIVYLQVDHTAKDYFNSRLRLCEP